MPAFVAFALAVGGCGPKSGDPSPPAPSRGSDTGSTSPGATAPATPADNTKTTPAKTVPDIKLTAEELFKESKKDSNFLIAKHASKLVELTGVVDQARLDLGGDPILFLLGGGGGGLDRVNCPVGDPNHWSKAFPGQTVTLWGTIPSSIYDPKRFVWNIKSVTGPEPPRLTAEEFVKAFAADPEASEKKCKGKRVILSGEVAEPKMNQKRLVGFILSLKEKKPSVVCYVIGFGGDKEEAFVKRVAKPGQKVTVIVEFDGYYSDEINMRGHVIDPPY
jgi:hypothetical protein